MLENWKRQGLQYYNFTFGKESFSDEKQKIQHGLVGIAAVGFLAFFFYRSLIAAVFLSPVWLAVMYILEQKEREHYKSVLRGQFKDAILGIAANLKAGYAVENAMRETLHEMDMLYGKKAPIYRELYRIVQGMANNISVEILMEQFAKRSGLDEIQEFADVFAIAKKGGGNLTEIIYETAGCISDKIEVDKEIQVLISARKLEQNIMSVIPFAIVTYIGIASRGYFDVLYHTLQGTLIMTACFAVYMVSLFLGQRIAAVTI